MRAQLDSIKAAHVCLECSPFVSQAVLLDCMDEGHVRGRKTLYPETSSVYKDTKQFCETSERTRLTVLQDCPTTTPFHLSKWCQTKHFTLKREVRFMAHSACMSPRSPVAIPEDGSTSVSRGCNARHASALIVVITFVLVTLCSGFATDVVTYHNDNNRTGANRAETILTQSNVNSTKFGKLFTLTMDSTVDAQPLYLSNLSIGGQVHNVLYVVTENDSVYAFDADSGALLWQVSLLQSGETASDTRNCGQITPTIGITSTPVIDRSSGPNGTIYVVAMSKTSSSTYFQRIHALDVTNGAEEFGGPVAVAAQYPGTGDNSQNGFVIFDPAQYAERTGLLLINHIIYTAWTSHCDIRPYTGWIMGYDESTMAQTSVLNVTPNGNEGAIWQSGSGIASDGKNIFFLDGNGTFDTTLDSQGFPSMGDYGNGFLKLSTKNNVLSVADYFNQFDTVAQSKADKDLGSGGALIVPPQKDASGTLHYLAIAAGKDKKIYIVDRNNMGKFNSSSNNIYQEVDNALGGGCWSMPAYYNNSVYIGPSGATLKQFKFTNAILSTSAVATSSNTFTYPGSTPSISANGTSSGIVWAIEHKATSVLHAFKASNIGVELYNSNQAANSRDQFGSASHFGTPTIVNGKVYVGTTTGVAVFGLL